MKLLRILAAACGVILTVASAALASQANLYSPTTGTVSGLTLTQNYNNALSALASCNSGASAPANDQSAAAVAGQCWLDTSTSPNAVRIYDGASWLARGYLDASNHLWIAPIGSGSSTIVSASTTDLCSTPNANLTISGTTTISSFSNTCQTGQSKVLTFSGSLTLTQNATSMILPNGGSNIVTLAGDAALATYLGGGNWKVTIYQRASGTALSASSDFTGAVYFDSVITVSLSSNTNDWSPTGLSSANMVALTCSNPINISGLLAPATNGKVIIINNVGSTNACTFTAQDAASTAANRFAFDRPIAVRPGRSLTVVYDFANARWRLIQELPSQSIAGTFKNLRVFNVATYFGDTAPASPNIQMKIAADELMLEDGNGGSARVSGVACTIDISTSGAGGLDTGTRAAGNWYYEYVIFNPATNTTSCIASLASTFGTITLPSGYTFGARVGANYYWTNNAVTGFDRLIQYGRRAQIIATSGSATPAMVTMATGNVGNVNTPTWSAISLSTFVPATASKILIVLGANGNGGQIIAAPNNSYGGLSNASSPFNPPAVSISAPTSGFASTWWTQEAQLVIESSSIYWASTSGSGNSSIFLMGWEDNL